MLSRIIFGLFLLLPRLACAYDVSDWQINFQEAASPVMQAFHDFHNILLYMCFIITGIICSLLAWVCFRYNKKANPNPSKFTHNAVLEIIWTIIPVVIVISLLIPSIKLLYFANEVPESEMTIKIIGKQWYWTYGYDDESNISFDSVLDPNGKLKLLDVDNKLVLPVDTNIRFLITGADVIHSWAVPAFGIKTDAVPGRINETWVRITKRGQYYGQCSELCGRDHGFMPISIEAVSKEDFVKWKDEAKTKFGS